MGINAVRYTKGVYTHTRAQTYIFAQIGVCRTVNNTWQFVTTPSRLTYTQQTPGRPTHTLTHTHTYTHARAHTMHRFRRGKIGAGEHTEVTMLVTSHTCVFITRVFTRTLHRVR